MGPLQNVIVVVEAQVVVLEAKKFHFKQLLQSYPMMEYVWQEINRGIAMEVKEDMIAMPIMPEPQTIWDLPPNYWPSLKL